MFRFGAMLERARFTNAACLLQQIIPGADS